MAKGQVETKRAYRTPRPKSRRPRWLLPAIVVLLAALFIGSLVLAYDQRLIISHVYVEGNKTVSDQEIEAVVEEALSGKYLYVYPKRNAVLYPADEVVAAVEQAFPRLSSIELEEGDNMQSLSLSVSERRGQYLWCPLNSVEADHGASSCYFADETGFVFSPAPEFSGHLYLEFVATSTENPIGRQPLGENNFRRLVQLENDLSAAFASSSLAQAKIYRVFPGELDDWNYLVQGSPVDTPWEIRIDLAQDFSAVLDGLRSVLADEKFASELAENNGNLEYLDLRFAPKIFYRFRD